MNEYKPAFPDFYKALNKFLKADQSREPHASYNDRLTRFDMNLFETLKSIPDFETDEKAELFKYGIILFTFDTFHDLPHVFVENPDFVPFLREMSVPDLTVINEFHTDSGKPVFNESSLSSLLKKDIPSVSAYAVHTTDDCLLVATFKNKYPDGSDCMTVFASDSSGGSVFRYPFNSVPDEKDVAFINSTPPLKFAINFMSYCQAFPECLRDGVPNLFTRKEKAGYPNSRVLKVSPEILDKDFSNGRFVTPHFRRGHFRRLESDYYTKKKGQIVFVKASMVRGRAKTLKGQSASLHER